MLCTLEFGELLQFLQTCGRIIVNRGDFTAVIQQMFYLSPGLFLSCCQRFHLRDMLFAGFFCPAFPFGLLPQVSRSTSDGVEVMKNAFA